MGLPFYNQRTGYTTLYRYVRLICKLVATYNVSIRPIIPENRRVQYDAAIAAIQGLCTLLEEIDRFREGVNDAQ